MVATIASADQQTQIINVTFFFFLLLTNKLKFSFYSTLNLLFTSLLLTSSHSLSDAQLSEVYFKRENKVLVTQ